MRKIPLLWFVLALVFSPPGGAFAVLQAGQSGSCPADQAAGTDQHQGMDQHHQGRQTGSMHDCCKSHACGKSSHAQCSDHCTTPSLGLLGGVRITLSATPALIIADLIQPQPPQLTNLPFKPPRA